MEDYDIGKAAPTQYLRRDRERFSTPHTLRDPNKVDKIELESEDLQGMIHHPPNVGAVRFHHEPESINTSHPCFKSTILQHNTSLITARGPSQLEGARWHLLTQVVINPASFEARSAAALRATLTRTSSIGQESQT